MKARSRARSPALSPAMKSLATALLLIGLVSLATAAPLSLTLQTRSPLGRPTRTPAVWPAERTAVIVCDMWDLHHCRNAVVRANEMAPRMNAFLEKARAAGTLIIHAPSSCMKAYEGTPARQRALSAPPAATLPEKIDEWCRQIPSEELAVYPIDQSDGGEDDDPAEHAAWAKELAAKGLNPRQPWTRQMEALRIDPERDACCCSACTPTCASPAARSGCARWRRTASRSPSSATSPTRCTTRSAGPL